MEMNSRKKFSDPDQSYQRANDSIPPRKKYSEPEDLGIDQSYQRAKFDYSDSIDPATRLILMRSSQSSAPRTRLSFNDDGPRAHLNYDDEGPRTRLNYDDEGPRTRLNLDDEGYQTNGHR